MQKQTHACLSDGGVCAQGLNFYVLFFVRRQFLAGVEFRNSSLWPIHKHTHSAPNVPHIQSVRPLGRRWVQLANVNINQIKKLVLQTGNQMEFSATPRLYIVGLKTPFQWLNITVCRVFTKCSIIAEKLSNDSPTCMIKGPLKSSHGNVFFLLKMSLFFQNFCIWSLSASGDNMNKPFLIHK